jgi:hypothetical protein
VLLVLNPRAWPADPQMAHIKAVRNIMRQRIVPEHGDPVVNDMAVSGGLAFCQDSGAIGPRFERHAGDRYIADTLDQEIALRV